MAELQPRSRKYDPPSSSSRWHDGIPRATGWPFFGNVFDVSADLRGFLTRQYRKLGPVFQFRAINHRYIALVGPEANQFVQKHGRNCLRSSETWRDFNSALGAENALPGMDGSAHARMRKAQMRGFSGRYFETRLDSAVQITRRIAADWPEDQPIVAHHAMQQIIAEQLAILTTGVSAQDYFNDLVISLEALLRVHVMGQRPRWFLRLPRKRQALRRLEDLYRLVLAQHQTQVPPEGRDLVDDLIHLHHSDPVFFPETDLMIAILGPFFAGLETAANTSAFMLYALLTHADLLTQMTEEADSLLDGQPLSPDRLQALDITPRVVQETLRMYPAIPALKRTVANAFEFGGCTVPAGAKILIGNTVTNHLPECFPDPDRFDIDRFGPERSGEQKPGALAPFGLGTHRCLGENFAQLQIAVTCLVLLHDFELSLGRPGYRLKITHTPGPHPAKSFTFRVRRRRPRL